MADCHDIFVSFNERITLNDSRCKSLMKSRKALRKRIRKHFKDNEIKPIPRFHGQGSFEIGTATNPLDQNYDLDDGIYLLVDQALESTPKTVHGWVVDAVDGHTNEAPVDKNTCVRVLFADENNPHHIDLPIYYKTNDGAPHLAHRRDGWIESDPREFAQWFEGQCDEGGQLKRIVRYVKAWRDYKNIRRPKTFVLTTLVAMCYVKNDRDDVALRDTLAAVHSSLSSNFSCKRPSTPKGEELLDNMNVTQQEHFLEALKDFEVVGTQAINNALQSEACIRWKKFFGHRFPCELAEDVADNVKSWDKAPFIKSEARSA